MSGVASPELTKVIIIAGGLLIALTAWNTLHKHMDNWAGSPVYGEHQQQVVAPEREELKSLPIVVANEARHIDLNSDLDSSEAAIQKAFMVPVAEEVVEEEPKVSLVQQLLALHKPSIAAIGGGGVIINGHFWAINEQIQTMPVRDNAGMVFYPIVANVRDGVLLRVGDEEVKLPYRL